mmetsp:Transcript_13910/g.26876  ORF Transcript_13910/g.26876 Transcript_13910/m.26876 type:complete len:339 (-) Transcript_13910:116-1132(-)
MAATANAGTEAAAMGPSAPKRPGVGGLKWSEVRQTVQQPDGSVRTSAPFKGGACSAVSPSRTRPLGLGKYEGPTKATNATASSSREGASRGGSSGKSSRSSSRDPLARDGDVSSRCSSGGWDTSTNSSEMSRPRTPPDAAPSPSATALLMPDPIRTSQMLPPALFDEVPETKEKGPTADDVVLSAILEHRAGLKWDPFGRDRRPLEAKKSHEKQEWSPEPLVKYLQGVVAQIDANLQNHCVPTSEKLDAFVSRLASNMHRQTKHAPKSARHLLQSMFKKSFRKIWNFVRNEKVSATTPPELKVALQGVIDNVAADFGVNPELLVVQPRPRRRTINTVP